MPCFTESVDRLLRTNDQSVGEIGPSRARRRSPLFLHHDHFDFYEEVRVLEAPVYFSDRNAYTT